ncbi:hypothetical protein JNO12_17150 [Erwinia aphidicola]|nr:hypothetical protein [Erwinia aphidicola]
MIEIFEPNDATLVAYGSIRKDETLRHGTTAVLGYLKQKKTSYFLLYKNNKDHLSLRSILIMKKESASRPVIAENKVRDLGS